MQLFLISGLSGSGKSVALNVLEDSGYYCVDNLPAELLHVLIEQSEAGGHQRKSPSASMCAAATAFVLLPQYIEKLKQQNIDVHVLFLDAKTETLVKRFSETRRLHPLSDGVRTLPECVALERELLAEIANIGHHIDTSELNANALRAWIKQFITLDRARLTLLFESFGFKNGMPLDADLVFDVRCLPNPHYDPVLRPLTGRDQPVIDFLEDTTARAEDVCRHPQLRRELAAQLRRRQPQLPHRRHRLHRRAASLGVFRRKTGTTFQIATTSAVAPSRTHATSLTVLRHIKPGDYLTLLAGVLCTDLDNGHGLVRRRGRHGPHPQRRQGVPRSAVVARPADRSARPARHQHHHHRKTQGAHQLRPQPQTILRAPGLAAAGRRDRHLPAERSERGIDRRGRRNMTASTTDKQDSGYGRQETGEQRNPRIPHPVSRILLDTTAEDHHIAKMAAVALGLTVLENAIPSPLPGVKPGLANIVTLIVLARYGWRAAAWVSLLRVVAGSLLFGNFLAPGFFLSLSGAVCSLAVLALSLHLPQRWFGPVTDSILAAFAHIAGQMTVVYLWLIPHSGIAYLIPIFATAALVFGTVNGLIAASFMDNGDKADTERQP